MRRKLAIVTLEEPGKREEFKRLIVEHGAVNGYGGSTVDVSLEDFCERIDQLVDAALSDGVQLPRATYEAMQQALREVFESQEVVVN